MAASSPSRTAYPEEDTPRRLAGCPARTWLTAADLCYRNDLAPGEYTLIVGLYDAVTGRRLAVTNTDGTPQGDFMGLGTIKGERSARDSVV